MSDQSDIVGQIVNKIINKYKKAIYIFNSMKIRLKCNKQTKNLKTTELKI